MPNTKIIAFCVVLMAFLILPCQLGAASSLEGTPEAIEAITDPNRRLMDYNKGIFVDTLREYPDFESNIAFMIPDQIQVHILYRYDDWLLITIEYEFFGLSSKYCGWIYIGSYYD